MPLVQSEFKVDKLNPKDLISHLKHKCAQELGVEICKNIPIEKVENESYKGYVPDVRTVYPICADMIDTYRVSVKVIEVKTWNNFIGKLFELTIPANEASSYELRKLLCSL